jgi:hypothetical protein
MIFRKGWINMNYVFALDNEKNYAVVFFLSLLHYFPITNILNLFDVFDKSKD